MIDGQFFASCATCGTYWAPGEYADAVQVADRHGRDHHGHATSVGPRPPEGFTLHRRRRWPARREAVL